MQATARRKRNIEKSKNSYYLKRDNINPEEKREAQ